MVVVFFKNSQNSVNILKSDDRNLILVQNGNLWYCIDRMIEYERRVGWLEQVYSMNQSTENSVFSSSHPLIQIGWPKVFF